MKQYLQERLGIVILLISCAGIISLSFWLYGLPMNAIWYPAILCLILIIVSGIIDYRRYAKKHKDLTELLKSADINPEVLKNYEKQTDKDYQEIIALIRQQKSDLELMDMEKISDMTDYYTTWAHQIKTPIASMKLTLSGEDTPQARSLNDELSRIEQYVGMVMGYLRLNSDSTDYIIREAELDKILKSSIRTFRSQFINKGLKLDYQATDRTVITDEKWLSFVIEQVLSNSLKYTKEGIIKIAVTGDELAISDTGIGIAPEDLPRIFEKGYTGFNGRTDKKASGLGLYLCSRICHELGHSIRAESKVSEGTTVYIGLKRDEHLYD